MTTALRLEMKKSIKSQYGASLVEYALLLAFIAMVAIAAVRSFGDRVNDQFELVEREWEAATQ